MVRISWLTSIFSINKNSKVNKSWAGAVTSSDIVYGVSTQNGGQIVAIDKDGKCVDVIGFNKKKIAMPALLEIREIDNDEILFVAGRTHDGGKKGRMYVKNLTSGKEKRCSIFFRFPVADFLMTPWTSYPFSSKISAK